MKRHKFNIFPQASAEDFSHLVGDIEQNGYDQSMPIMLYEGDILDGWNRWLACEQIGVKPATEKFTGTDAAAIEYMMRTNKRRNLTSSQWATVAAEADHILEALREAASERQGAASNFAHVRELIPEHDKMRSRDAAAAMFNTNGRYIDMATQLKQTEPELFEEVKAGKTSLPKAKKKARAKQREAERSALAESVKAIEPSDRWTVYQADIKTWQPAKQYDFIITDPPYLKEYIPLYETLAQRANDILKPGGLLVAMAGQSYLDQLYDIMTRHLDYYWTAAYLTPGQPTPLRQRQVNTSWKPLLMFIKGGDKYTGKIFGDVFTSDRNDKDFHEWGQSVSGMLSIISQVCLPGQSILDPFCGAGTTGVAALMHGCLFDGIDINSSHVETSTARLAEVAI